MARRDRRRGGWLVLARAAAWALCSTATAGADKPFRFAEWSLADPLLSPSKNFTVQMPEDRCTPEWAACLIDSHNVHPLLHKHFPHAAQNLLPCWSFFTRFPRLRPVVVLHDRIRMHAGDWPHGLLALMGATIESSRTWYPSGRCAVRGRLVNRPAPGGLGREVRWLAREVDARLLRAQLRRTQPAESARFRRADDHSLHVGLLTRSGSSRSLAYEGAIGARLRTELPRANHSVALFNGWPFARQAAWVAAQDVIISPHGAQNVNFAFARPCAAVAEIFPRYYYVPSFYLTLVQAAGAIPFAAYPGAFPLRDSRTTDRIDTFDWRMRVRNVKLNVSAADVAGALPAMLRARQRCLNARAAAKRRGGGDEADYEGQARQPAALAARAVVV